MAQVNVVSRQGRSYIGAETTFDTLPTMVGLEPIDTPELTLEQEELPVTDTSIYQHDPIDPIKGLKKATAKFTVGIRPNATLYNTASVPAAWWLSHVLKSAFGGHTQYAGQTISAASSATSFTVTTGADAMVGTWCSVLVSGTYEPALITNRSGNVLTVFPALSGTPTATTNAFIGCDTFYPAEQFTTSYYFQHACVQDATDSKYSLKGGRMDSIDFTTERGQLIKAMCNMAFIDWDGPTSADTVAVTQGTTVARANMAIAGATTLLQDKTTSTRTHYVLESFKVNWKPGHIHIPDYGGSQGNQGVMKLGDRNAGSVTLKIRFDASRDTTDWVNRTELQCICIVPIDATTSKRFVIFDMGTLVLVGKPPTADEGGRRIMTLNGMLKLDERCTDQSTDSRRAPLRIALL